MRLASARWDYIDRFAPNLWLVGRSSSHVRHMGSVHIITFAKLTRRATLRQEEPTIGPIFTPALPSLAQEPLRQTMGARAICAT
jgi:hypothetical protein